LILYLYIKIRIERCQAWIFYDPVHVEALCTGEWIVGAARPPAVADVSIDDSMARPRHHLREEEAAPPLFRDWRYMDVDFISMCIYIYKDNKVEGSQ